VGLLGICKDRSETVVLLPERVFIPVTRLFCRTFRIMDVEAGRIPLFHLNHGVVIVGQSLFGFNRTYPGVNRPSVITQKLIKICISHEV
jgi:hypothetical protein